MNQDRLDAERSFLSHEISKPQSAKEVSCALALSYQIISRAYFKTTTNAVHLPRIQETISDNRCQYSGNNGKVVARIKIVYLDSWVVVNNWYI